MYFIFRHSNRNISNSFFSHNGFYFNCILYFCFYISDHLKTYNLWSLSSCSIISSSWDVCQFFYLFCLPLTFFRVNGFHFSPEFLKISRIITNFPFIACPPPSLTSLHIIISIHFRTTFLLFRY